MIEKYFYIFPFAAFFLIVPVLVFFILSRVSGWSSLAEVYRFDGKFTGTAWKFASGRMGFVNYNGILFLQASSRGFYLSLPGPFKLFSPPLLVPWDDFYIEGTAGIFNKQFVLRFRKKNNVTLKLYKTTALKVFSEAEKSGFPVKDKNRQPYVLPE